MAGINSTIRITDGMSPALKSMNKALTIVLNNFDALQQSSGNSIDVNQIMEARAELANAANAVNELENNLHDAGDSQSRFNREVNDSNNSMKKLVGQVKTLIATYASFQTMRSLVDLSDQMSQTESRLNLIVDDAGVEALEQKIFDSATRSRASYLDTASAVAAFAQRAGDAFSGNDEVIAFTETLNKMYVIAGASAQEQSSSMLQLTQALGSGVLRGEEFNAVFEAAPNIMQAVADYMQVPIGSLRDMAADGKITADIVKNAIFNATEKVNEDFDNMNWTWAQVTTNFKNYAIDAFNPVLKKISELANNQNVLNFVTGLGIAMGAVANGMLNVFDILSQVGTFIAEYWSILAPIIFGVATALAYYYGYLLVTKAVELASAGIKIISALASFALASATGAQASATAMATAAQYGWNTALLASPITWILLILIAVIAVIYIVIGVINKVTGSTISATGVIVGALASAGAFIWNLFLGILDIVLQVISIMINKWVYFANFFGNLFNDPIASVLYLFRDMADAVLGIIQSIASAIDKVFGKNLSASVSGWRDGLDKMVEDVVSEYGNGSYEKILDEVDWSSESLGLKRISYTDAWSYGYSLGEEIDDKLSSFSLDKILESGSNALSDALNDDYLSEIGKNVGGIGDDTSNIADSMEITEEDLKYLRDIAEKEAINRFTTAQIKIDMQNNNSINSSMDIDGIVTQLEDKLYESMAIAAEGVH